MAEKLNKDAVYRAAKSKDKDYTINDGGGLVLLVIMAQNVSDGLEMMARNQYFTQRNKMLFPKKSIGTIFLSRGFLIPMFIAVPMSIPLVANIS